ncbi:MAG: FG-GAP-like repeat-containing protein [Planctomycetia bacterium]|nr:FG-GAP-like repeat-containing protein [Planctomycetia bacterium]
MFEKRWIIGCFLGMLISPAFAEEEGKWTFSSSQWEGKIEYVAEKEEWRLVVPPVKEGVSDEEPVYWNVTSEPILRKGSEKTGFFVAPILSQEGRVSFQVQGRKNGKSWQNISRGCGVVMPVESTSWIKLGAKVELPADCDAWRFVLSGSEATNASFRWPEGAWGEPMESREAPHVEGFFPKRQPERFDRGLVVLQNEEGIYLGWRFQETDTEQTTFEIYRREKGAEDWTRLTEKPITQTTDFVDTTVDVGKDYQWEVRTLKDGKPTGETFSATRQVTEKPQAYVSIPLPKPVTFSRLAMADLDGDGRLDFVVAHPNFNTDPYHQEGYWKPSPETQKLLAVNADGKFLWELDLGPSIETGIWYAPFIAHDLDGDGKAEVIARTAPGDHRDATGRVFSGEEFCTVFCGETGKVKTQIPWIPRDGFTYNYGSRHMLAVAYLDGKTPFLIVHRGTYHLQITRAYQLREGKLELAWEWNNKFSPQWGGGAHTLHCVDVDGDGRDEICMGTFVLDDNGTILWRTGFPHPDGMYVGEINPNHPGMEIYLGVEGRSQTNGMVLLDAKTGEVLWGHQEPTNHIHGACLCSDIDPRHPGCECYGGEHPRSPTQDRFLWSSDGKLLARTLDEKEFGLRGLAPKSAWWDADEQRELVLNNQPLVKWLTQEKVGPKIEGNVTRVFDLLGDWREELVVSLPGEIRIYSTTIPAVNRKKMLLQDANYRATLTETSMGYAQVPLLSQ